MRRPLGSHPWALGTGMGVCRREQALGGARWSTGILARGEGLGGEDLVRQRQMGVGWVDGDGDGEGEGDGLGMRGGWDVYDTLMVAVA